MELRVHRSDDESPVDPIAVTLRDAYEQFHKPSIEGRRAESTPRQYRTAIGHWERFVAMRSDATGLGASTTSTRAPFSLPLTIPVDLVPQISDEMLNEWGTWLMSPDGANLSLDTAEKQWKWVRAILRKVGPRETGNNRALGLLDRIPTMDPLSELAAAMTEHEGPVDLPDEHIGRIFNACDVARWPSDHAPLQWQTYVMILATLGPRVNDAATLQATDFVKDQRSPARSSTRVHPHGWLVYYPDKTRRKKPARLILPLPPCVRCYVDELTRRREGQLFAWRNAKSHQFRDQWTKIVEQAGLPHVQRRHFRSTANIRWDRASPGKELHRWVLGHSSRDVNDQHYMRREGDLIEAAAVVEVPEPFLSPPAGKAIQTFLF